MAINDLNGINKKWLNWIKNTKIVTYLKKKNRTCSNKIDKNWNLFEHKNKIRTYLTKFDKNWDKKVTKNKIKENTIPTLASMSIINIICVKEGEEESKWKKYNITKKESDEIV